MLYDLHCHLGFTADAAAAADAAERAGIAAFSATVSPDEFAALRNALGAREHIRAGLGLHPWRIAEGAAECAGGGCAGAGGGDLASGGGRAIAGSPSCAGNPAEAGAALARDLERFEALAAATPFVGEIGLDFAGERAESAALQQRALDALLAACNATGPKVISLHAVRAAGPLLDALEQHRAASRHACIMHWFSGTSDELQRAAKMGCFFSVGPRMLATKRGRAYAQAIPAKRLLLETDEPAHAGDPWRADAWHGSLESTLAHLAELRRTSPAVLADEIGATSRQLLGL